MVLSFLEDASGYADNQIKMMEDNSMSRIFDIVFSLLVITVLLPIFGLIAIAIVIIDGWPFWFLHERVGKDGNHFRLIKFRTMSRLAGAELGRFDAGCGNRITRLGRLLRASKLDELPQFFNVLKGDMAIVGPRPEVQKWVDIYPECWTGVLAVRPGITDPASIAFRDEEMRLAAEQDPVRFYCDEILPRKLSLYNDYVSNRSFTKDLSIIGATAMALFSRRGKAE